MTCKNYNCDDEVCEPVEVFGDEYCEKMTGERDVILSKWCGRRNCRCDKCQHEGHRCYPADRCNLRSDPTACENFNLVYCVKCIDEVESATLILKRKCRAGIEELETVAALDPEDCCPDRTAFVAAIVPGDLVAGWWCARLRVKFKSGKVVFFDESRFRVLPCPTEEPDPAAACDDC